MNNEEEMNIETKDIYTEYTVPASGRQAVSQIIIICISMIETRSKGNAFTSRCI